jgi:hypothetical protein
MKLPTVTMLISGPKAAVAVVEGAFDLFYDFHAGICLALDRHVAPVGWS